MESAGAMRWIYLAELGISSTELIGFPFLS